MANCCNCSAPLPSNSLHCEYCGTRNDVDLAGIHRYTTHEIESARNCPRCGVPLRTIDLDIGGTFLIERCEECLGLFFDPNELEALLQATVSNVFSIDRGGLAGIAGSRRSADYAVSYLKCPVCSTVMNRVNFGTKSGVIVDRCREHGVWLDAGELRHLFEWMKAGGELLDRERRAERRRDEEREREKRSRQGAPGSEGGDSGFESYVGTLRSEEPDLFDMVRRAIGFFLR